VDMGTYMRVHVYICVYASVYVSMYICVRCEGCMLPTGLSRKSSSFSPGRAQAHIPQAFMALRLYISSDDDKSAVLAVGTQACNPTPYIS